VRNNHTAAGFFSEDGETWTQIGDDINILPIDRHQNDFNDFTGNQQGLFVVGKSALFDSYIYRDAYAPIMAGSPANFSGVSSAAESSYLASISHNDWAMYAGAQFGKSTSSSSSIDYDKTARQINITASSNAQGGIVDVWLGGINTGELIAAVEIENTESSANYQTFSAVTTEEITGSHDVYFHFKGEESASELFRIKHFSFSEEITTSNETNDREILPESYRLQQNYPNPFNPSTMISYQLPVSSDVSLKVFNILGREVATLVNTRVAAGQHQVQFDASSLSSGMYFYTLETNDFSKTRKMLLIK